MGFAAISGLVGIFSDQAALKLKDVAETLFKRPDPGDDSLPQEKPNAANSGDASRTTDTTESGKT